MKVLLLGHKGQLGKSLLEMLPDQIDVSIDKKFEKKIIFPNNFKEIYNKIKPDIIINSIAYTNVDKAEDDIECFKINYNFIKTVSQVISKNTLFIHISTDYVFDGNKKSPYSVLDLPNPLNNYGKSKLKGEIYIKKTMNNYIIIRTSALFSSFGVNFVKKIYSLILQKKIIKVVNDQYFIPTPTKDLANIIWKIVLNYSKTDIINSIYHFVGHGKLLNWYDFANLINKKLGKSTRIIPVNSKQIVQKANRPAYSVLSDKLIRDKYNFYSKNWEDYLDETILEINN